MVRQIPPQEREVFLLMSSRESFSFPLIVAAISTPSWIQLVQNFWAFVLPAMGAVLVAVQIRYYWKNTKQ
jgi:hypothetical protein